ncbi:hypothetical protein FOXG_19907 [Fusarium oxysporum f. sp. lycopersici 4287]|uniref:Uncharacterized protein n=1 Tax=Fusarium oxysporum f. sp. lycopersici (strain 4287 / CBS 123668 / FGSC 9935 / NRRL 34936) TaxID=426428 RepID=A0A0J9V8F4_FUSO4|nr:hypothetical protein FOXG_19907 [Fusarium oxysporum f. sp. lycopersici 4287]KNB07764.1 hypothetical protein FOXG_19907 [Fusarium oxysporum f. sp. lycopersici 4287]
MPNLTHDIELPYLLRRPQLVPPPYVLCRFSVSARILAIRPAPLRSESESSDSLSASVSPGMRNASTSLGCVFFFSRRLAFFCARTALLLFRRLISWFCMASSTNVSSAFFFAVKSGIGEPASLENFIVRLYQKLLCCLLVLIPLCSSSAATACDSRSLRDAGVLQSISQLYF